MPKKLSLKFQQSVASAPDEAFDAWLNPKIPGTLWSVAEQLVFNPAVNALFYFSVEDYPHFGRFMEITRSTRIRHTLVSPNTSGEESMVTVDFKKRHDTTIVTLMHANVPDTKGGRAHEEGWNYFLNTFAEHFAKQSARQRT
jgi:hypothetical protein